MPLVLLRLSKLLHIPSFGVMAYGIITEGVGHRSI